MIKCYQQLKQLLKNEYVQFLIFLMHCRWRSNNQERRVESPSNGLTQPHICACLKSAPGFLTSYVMVYFVLSELSCEVIAGFVNIGGIIDYHCLNFLSIISIRYQLMISTYKCTSCHTLNSVHINSNSSSVTLTMQCYRFNKVLRTKENCMSSRQKDTMFNSYHIFLYWEYPMHCEFWYNCTTTSVLYPVLMYDIMIM